MEGRRLSKTQFIWKNQTQSPKKTTKGTSTMYDMGFRLGNAPGGSALSLHFLFCKKNSVSFLHPDGINNSWQEAKGQRGGWIFSGVLD